MVARILVTSDQLRFVFYDFTKIRQKNAHKKKLPTPMDLNNPNVAMEYGSFRATPRKQTFPENWWLEDEMSF